MKRGLISELVKRQSYRAKRDGFIPEFARGRNPQAERRGFTLIELLVVISIIGLLSSVGLASFTRAQERARDAKRISDLTSLRNSLEIFYAEENAYVYNSDSWQNIDDSL